MNTPITTTEEANFRVEKTALGNKEWPFKQITKGGPQYAINNEMIPILIKSAFLIEFDAARPLVDEATLSPLDALRYPPKK